MVVNRSWNSCSKAYLVTLADIQDTSAREVVRSHLSCILSFDLIGEHKNKRFYVMEIELPLGFADVISRRERSDDRKCVAVRRLAVTQPELKFPGRVWCTGSENGFQFDQTHWKPHIITFKSQPELKYKFMMNLCMRATFVLNLRRVFQISFEHWSRWNRTRISPNILANQVAVQAENRR